LFHPIDTPLSPKMPILLRRCSALHPSSQDQSNIPPTIMESPSSTKFQPPLFYVSEGYGFSTLKNALFDITDPSSFQFRSTPKYLIIHAGNVIAWNTIFKYLADNEQLKFHTHLPKPLKPYSVFIRHLHLSTPVEDIQAHNTDKGHEVIQVTNILHRINKNAMPLFRIDLKPATNNSDILNLDSLLHTKIKIELPKKKRAPPQCKSCQAYFHTSNFCHHTPRWVKCGDNHISFECSKLPSTPAKCELCSGSHTAPYKGCPVYKNITKNQKNLQGHNFNEKTGSAEALLSFSYSLMVIDTRKPYNSTFTKIFGKYMNISKFK
jgi:hypothetical protein